MNNEHKEFSKYFKIESDLDKSIVNTDASGWIQWKGTNVCIDIHCDCGHHGHFDGDFMYYFQCPKCKEIFTPQTTIAMHKLKAEHLNYVKRTSNCIKTCQLDEE